MTEPAVASSDATNIESRIERDGDEYVINGRKWWTSGAGDPRCKIYIFMGKTDSGRAAPFAAVDDRWCRPTPRASPSCVRCSVFGYDDAPHGHMEVRFENVRVPASNILLGEGRGFEIAQGRLGPGRIHHCMRADRPGRARARDDVPARLNARVAFGRTHRRAGRDARTRSPRRACRSTRRAC